MVNNELVKRFKLENPQLIEDLKNCEHYYQGQPNPYHLEGSVWNHIELCLEQSENDLEILFSLFHDIGKIERKREENNKDSISRLVFFGHPGLSVFKSINLILKYYPYSKFSLIYLLIIISWHDDLFSTLRNKQNVKDFLKRFKDVELLNFYLDCVNIDILGRKTAENITQEPIKKDDLISQFVPFHSQNDEGKEKSITLLIGPPGSGKSTYIDKNKSIFEKNNQVVICRDDLIEKYGTGENYTEKWKSCDQKQIDQEYQKIINNNLKLNKSIILDATNLSRKSRRRILTQIPKSKEYEKKAIVFLTDYQILLYNNKNRPGKNIPEKIIKIMCTRFNFPGFDEFDQISVIINSISDLKYIL
jgi:predicted kinase